MHTEIQYWYIHSTLNIKLNMSLSSNQNFDILNETDFKPASFLEIADGLMANGVREMYHAIVEEKDIVTLFQYQN